MSEAKLSALFAARALELGLSVRDLAAKLEVSEARARQILSARNLREDNIQRVAAALGLRLTLALVENRTGWRRGVGVEE